METPTVVRDVRAIENALDDAGMFPASTVTSPTLNSGLTSSVPNTTSTPLTSSNPIPPNTKPASCCVIL
jgi:hypothetical protein